MDPTVTVNIDSQSILSCFQTILNPNTDSNTRKNADLYLNQIEKNPVELLPKVMQIVDQQLNDQIKFQALLFFSNVIKRTWTLRRFKEKHSAYQSLKKNIRAKIVLDLYHSPKYLLFTYFQIVKYIAGVDFPHIFPQLTQLVIKMAEQISLDQNCVVKFKQLKQKLFNELTQRKGSTSIKLYQDLLQPILQKIFIASNYFQNQIQASIQKGGLNSITVKLSKYCDQIIFSIMRLAPCQILDHEESLRIPQQIHKKLNHLLQLHQDCNNSNVRKNLQKNIKSLIYDLGTLQQTNPFILSLFIYDYFVTLSRIIVDPSNFVKNATLKYTLLAMRKFIKQFSYSSETEQFLIGLKSKQKSINYLDLRKICHDAYVQALTPSTVQGILNQLISNTMCLYCKNQNVSFDIEQNMMIDKNQEKQFSIENYIILLIEAILQKFTDQAYNLIKNIVILSFKNQFQGIDPLILSNIFGVLALLPKTVKKNALYTLSDIPIVEILGFIYQNVAFKNKIPTLIAGWFDYFTNDQLTELIKVLLEFIQNQSETFLLLACCQSLDKIIVTKKYLLNADIISKIVPIIIRTFQKTDCPQVLWPMVNLLSNIMIQCEFNSDIILSSFEKSSLQVLISSKSSILIEALSQMFKNILCIIPRKKPAQGVYKLVCHFLDNHLSKLISAISQKVLSLWYIVVRQYSIIQNCNSQLIKLYHTHYQNNLFLKTPLLIYILEEYMLLGFVQTNLSQFNTLIYQFYKQAEQMDKTECQQLKIAALSFQITLITKYTLSEVNNSDMLQAILKDFYNLDPEKISVTVHNSLLSIINRYIIMHRVAFFAFLQSMNVDLQQFYSIYFENMQFLTSQSSKKINSLAVLSLISHLPNEFLINKLHFILMIIIPSIQNFRSSQHINPLSNSPFTGKIINSPTLRFASNSLSERKEQIRKKDLLEGINLYETFKSEINNLCLKLGTDLETIAHNFIQKNWIERFYKFFY